MRPHFLLQDPAAYCVFLSLCVFSHLLYARQTWYEATSLDADPPYYKVAII